MSASEAACYSSRGGASTKLDSRTQFEIIAPITDIEPIAVGRGVRIRRRLWRQFGRGRWRKMKGTTTVRLLDGTIFKAEVHWYEAHGIGHKLMKIKQPLE